MRSGAEYYRRGAVHIDFHATDYLIATVRGSRLYSVMLAYVASTRTLVVECTCPYFTDRLEPCKHIWATVLAADDRGYLPRAEDAERLAVPDPDAPETGEPRPLAAGPRETTRRPAWRATLEAVTDAIAHRASPPQDGSWPADRRLLYVIDLPATREAGCVTLEVACRDRRANGTWGRIKSSQITRGTVDRLPDPDDRRILSLLCGAENSEPWHYGGYSGAPLSPRLELPAALLTVLLPLACGTGRCLVRRAEDDADPPAVCWDDGPPWRLQLDVTDEGRTMRVTGSLRRGDERMGIDAPLLLCAEGVLLTGRSLARLDDGGAFPWIPHFREQPALEVPADRADELLEALLGTVCRPLVTLPPALECEERAGTPRPRLVARSPRWSSSARARVLRAELSFDYGGSVVAAADPRRAVLKAQERALLVRDRSTEQAAAQRLAALGFERPPAHHGTEEGVLDVPVGRFPAAARALLEAGWHVEAEGRLYRAPFAVAARVETGIDWFDVHAEASFEGGQTVPLPELLAALRAGEGHVRLGDGTLGVLPEDWMKRYAPLAQLATAEDGRLRFSRSQVGLLDAMLAEMPQVDADAPFRRLRSKVARFSGIRPAAAPRAFKGTLRSYQREGLGWMRFLQGFGFGGCLADDMGLGKTVQVLALLESRRARRGVSRNGDGPRPLSLVVVPRSLVFNWLEEAQRFTPRLRVLRHTGPGRAGSPEGFDGHDVVVTTYGTLRRDVAWLRETRFDYVVLDEAQAVKNPQTQAAKAVRLLRAEHRLALSGTPIENHLGELWSLFEFLNPGMLGSGAAWARRAAGDLREPDDGTRRMLSRALRPFILRRTKDQVATHLPAKVEQTVFCDLLPAERRRYDELRDHCRASVMNRLDRQGLARSKIHVLEALLRLRQAACHPGLIDPARAGERSAKLDLLLEQLADVVAQGHKALVFSQFTRLLSIVRDRLDGAQTAYEYLDGRTRKRAERVERFQQDPACPLFLVSLKAGGLGLNLTAADYVFLLDPWWNPAVEVQAIDRTHRIGQTRRIFAYRLIARGTVEERVLELQRSKGRLADAIIGADNSVMRSLTREDLELLLR